MSITHNKYHCQHTELLPIQCEHHFATIRSLYPMHTLLQYCQPQNDVMVESLKRMTTTLQARHHTRKQSGSPNELKDMVGERVMRAITGFLIVQNVSQHKVLYMCSMRQMAPPPPSRPPLRNFDRTRTYKEYRERERERSRRS